MSHREDLQRIHSFPQLIAFLRDEMGWPIESDDFEELTFDYTPEELGIDSASAAKIQEVKRLRPLVEDQPWGIFFVRFEPKRLPVVALRRILRGVVLRKRASANRAEDVAWDTDDLLFISNFGEGDARQISFAHFSQDGGKGEPALRLLEWNDLDTPLRLDAVAQALTQRLAWPDPEDDIESWRASWSSAFTLRRGETIATSRDLSIRLAELARRIRYQISEGLSVETQEGPLTALMMAFRTALVHDLTPDGFADMYAQTIAYGLLSARVTDPGSKTTDDLAAHLRTNPLLRELMATFFERGPKSLEADELGVNEVVQLLDDANMEEVLRDFGDRNPLDDPVIHFYELFLKEYDAKKRMQQGVFYTPRPVVSYIVRSVDELLRTEFGLADGLADTATWGELAAKQGVEIPGDVSPDQVFVQILDPATGTGTFLVEAIDVIHTTLVGKWKDQGLGEAAIRDQWDEYVSRQLLPRLHGFELMMAPYAIAHLKIGLKLHETGYHFHGDQRAQVYLTNALDPADNDEQRQLTKVLPALAHEAEAVAKVKRSQRFTVVLGNPPYSIQSANLSTRARALVEPYKWVDGERIRERNALQLEKNLQDDYVKFVRLSEATLETSGRGVFGLICNSSFLDGRSFRGMRRHLLGSMSSLQILDLHGSGKKTESSGGSGTDDENVFDIQQGVSITFGLRNGALSEARVAHGDIFGDRRRKSAFLMGNSVSTSSMTSISPAAPFYVLVPVGGRFPEYEHGIALNDFFRRFSSGVKTHRDAFAYAFTRAEMDARLAAFVDPDVSDDILRETYQLKDGPLWQLGRARTAVASQRNDVTAVRADYRPFDKRWLAYTDDIVRYTAKPTMRHMLDGNNLALLICQQQVERGFRHAFVTRTIADCCSVSGKSRETTSLFPAYLCDPGDTLFGSSRGYRSKNLSNQAAEAFSRVPNLEPPSPESMLAYVYALLYSPTYRARHADSLRSDFPRVLVPGSAGTFGALETIGRDLIALHLLESPKIILFTSAYDGPTLPEVGRIGWSQDTIWLNATATKKGQHAEPGTVGFHGVPEAVWDFIIGGYQVCQKWLKDRKGRSLPVGDIAHYQAILTAVSETLRLMEEIDEVIEEHGGWPGAFSVGAGVEG